MKKSVGILRFLGTNCDRDIWKSVEQMGLTPEWLWYADHFDWKQHAALIIPGGFSFGDYLRSGAMAARCPVMSSLKEATDHGVPTLGICNGFQILCEAGLLPGALVKNQGGSFIDTWVNLKLHSTESVFTRGLNPETTSLKLPIAHGDGRYYHSEDGQKQLWDKAQVWLTYQNNPNGSVADIAGVLNSKKNIAGLMPHPERAMAPWMGGSDGLGFFSILRELV